MPIAIVDGKFQSWNPVELGKRGTNYINDTHECLRLLLYPGVLGHPSPFLA